MSRISVIGNVNVDLLVWPAAELPPPGTDVPVESIQTRAAGAAGNTALALARLGCIPRLVGCVGDDHYGRFILDELAVAGIEEGVFVLPGEPTGISIAFEAPERDRSFLTLLGSLQTFEASMVPRTPWKEITCSCAGTSACPRCGAGARTASSKRSAPPVDAPSSTAAGIRPDGPGRAGAR
jgi:sugar/nucleoside kinase (ribokinase family)